MRQRLVPGIRMLFVIFVVGCNGTLGRFRNGAKGISASGGAFGDAIFEKEWSQIIPCRDIIAALAIFLSPVGFRLV